MGFAWAVVLTACGASEDGGARAEVAAETAVAEAAMETPAAAAAAVTTVAEEGSFTGLYVHLADAAAFTRCGSGRVLSVASQGAAAELERAYLLERSGPGDPALVTVIGRVETRTGMEGEPSPHLVVDRVEAVEGGAACPGEEPGLPLENVTWILEGLPEEDASLAVAGAWLRLDRDDRTVGGFTGCRDLSGSYEWTGTRLRFGSLDLQGGMCPAADVHAGMLEALRVTGSYRVLGRTLELMGEQGPVARLRGSRSR